MKSMCWDTSATDSIIKVARRILRQVYFGNVFVLLDLYFKHLNDDIFQL